MPDPCCPWCATPLAEHPAIWCLNAWVLEAVLGYERLEGDAIPPEVSPRDRPEPHMQVIWRNVDHWYCLQCGSVPSFCEDIRATWQLVEHLSRHGSSVSIWLSSTGRQGEVVVMGRHEAREYVSTVDAVPVAICRAALNAYL